VRPAVTPPPPPPAPSSFRPIHLAIVGTVAAASAGVLLAHGTRVENISFVFLAVVCTGVVAGLVYRTLAPLASDAALEEPEMVGGRTRAALERDKALTLRAIKELEFDRAMGKVSEADGQEMIGRLRNRAVRLMRQLDEGGAGYRGLIERELQARLGASQGGGASAEGRLGTAAAEQQPVNGTEADVPHSGIAGQAGLPQRARRERDAEEAAMASLATAGEAAVGACAVCGARNDPDARFCKKCGTKLGVPA
jgi:ribosomal protein L40E